MKRLISNVIALLLMAGFAACENDEQITPSTDKTIEEGTKEVIADKAMFDELTFNMFGNEFKSANGRTDGTLRHRFDFLFQDGSEVARVANEWNTCANVQVLQNAQGNYKLVFDFGDGCTTDEGFFKGKISFSGYETDRVGYIEMEFENFYHKNPEEVHEHEFRLSGQYKAHFQLYLPGDEDYDSTHVSDSYDSAYIEENFEGAFELVYAETYTETYAARGTVIFNHAGFKVIDHQFGGTKADGSNYQGELVNTLVYDLTCDNDIYLSGTVALVYNDENALVDFGNGQCDRIFTIVMKGVSITVDLDEVES